MTINDIVERHYCFECNVANKRICKFDTPEWKACLEFMDAMQMCEEVRRSTLAECLGILADWDSPETRGKIEKLLEESK